MSTYFNEPSYEQYPKIQLNLEFLPAKKIHIITPANNQQKQKFNPLIIFISNQDENLHLVPLSKLSSHGFTIAIIPSNQLNGNLKEQTRQVKSAIRYLLLHSNQFDIDTNRYFIWGEQSGASLAALCALTSNQLEWNNENPRIMPLRFKAALCYGLAEAEPLIVEIPQNQCAPLAIINGTDDEQTDRDQLKQFARALCDSDHEVEVAFLKNTVNATDAFYTPYMLTWIEEFFRKSM